jgi:predicted ATPase/class 3 adenylate cyclase
MTTNLPSGTVTFLFTDIEGSTKLAQEHPATWESLRARHHAILREAIESHNGYIFQIIGDAFCAAFHTAGDALRAAVKSQIDLDAENWNDAPIKVRMGIHTGKAEVQEKGEYHGFLTMSRVQRLLSASHGGQVLLSLATEELIRDELPENVSLCDMGEKRLKDLTRSEHIHQLVISNLPAEFPPLKTLDAYRHNLPAQMTSFIGREKEMAEIAQAIREHRLVTLTGVGGTGKTRLALQVAANLLDQFPDGVWFVELAPVSDPELIPQTILATFGISEQQGRTILQILTDYFGERSLLIVLDNCEHLIDASAKLADSLLNKAHSLKFLVTSREALGVKGEATWHVPSLSLPDLKHLPSIENLTQYEAVRLFIERAILVQPNFTVTNDNASFVAQICTRLDGIPLAIELATSRVKALSVEQISKRLDDRFHLLTGGARTSLPRQQTLRATIDWSYNLLSNQEKTLFRRLAVFVSGWRLEAAEIVCGGEGIESEQILDLLSQLVNKSLVTVENVGDESRYHRLETIRQYAREKLLDSGESETIRDRHLQFFLKLAEVAKPYLDRSDAVEWHDRIEADHDNLRLALDWTQHSEHNAESGLRLADALSGFWTTRGYLVEGRERSLSALNHARSFERTALYANVLQNAAWIANFQGDFPGARSLGNRSLAIYRELGDKLGISYALQTLGAVAADNKDYALAERTLQEAFQNRRDFTDVSITNLLTTMGWAAFGLGDYALARKRLNEALTLSLTEGRRGRTSLVLGGLAEVDLREGRYESASKLIEESLTIRREIGDKGQIGVALGVWAWIAVLQQDWDSAFSRLKESVAVREEIGDKGGLVWCLEKLGQVALGTENAEKAAKIFGSAACIRAAMGSTMDPFDQSEYERDLALLRKQLGEEKFNMAWDQGRALTLEKAMPFALEENS